MTPSKNNQGIRLPANAFSALREFLTSYLHEDFRDEYGSVAGAARAFRGDASREELSKVRAEWAHLKTRFQGQSIEAIQAALGKLGAAWRPEAASDLNDLESALMKD